MEEAVSWMFEAEALDLAAPPFLRWVGDRSLVRIWYTPDTAMVVDAPGRRACLLDEVFLATIWCTEGKDELVAEFEAAQVSLEPRDSDSPGLHELCIKTALFHGTMLPST